MREALCHARRTHAFEGHRAEHPVFRIHLKAGIQPVVHAAVGAGIPQVVERHHVLHLLSVDDIHIGKHIRRLIPLRLGIAQFPQRGGKLQSKGAR